MDEKFTLTCMNQAMAQMMGGEYVCEDEWGEEYPSSLPCDEEACIAACSTCGEQFNCDESHFCDWITCSVCYTQYIRGQGHSCTVVGDNNENENSGNNGSGGNGTGSGTGGNATNVGGEQSETELSPLEQAKKSLKKYIKEIALSNEDIFTLKDIFNQLSDQKGYGILLDFIEKNPVNKFLIDSNVSYGGYNSNNQSIVFNSSATIDTAIREELLHHMQNVLYENGISQYNKTNGGLSQIEFEVKVLQDILCAINSGVCGWYGDTDDGTSDYGLWIYDICSNGNIPDNNKLFNTNGETGKDYNYFLNLYNNKGPYSSPLKENLSPLLFNYMNSHQ